MEHLIKAKLLTAKDVVKEYLAEESSVIECLVTVEWNSQSKIAGTK